MAVNMVHSDHRMPYFCRLNDSWSSQDGMDDEIAAAYEDFLQMQHNSMNTITDTREQWNTK